MSKASELLAVDERDVGDAAEIEHADRLRPVKHPHHGAMIDRHQRRPLPAGGDIGGAEIVDHRNAEPARQRGAVAELHREVAIRLVQHGLAVETDNRNVGGGQAVRREIGFDRLGMHRGQKRLGLRQRLRPLIALAEVAGGGDRPPQHRPLGVAIGAVAGRAEPTDAFPVGIEERDVHPVIGGAAHQPDGREVTHRWLRNYERLC